MLPIQEHFNFARKKSRQHTAHIAIDLQRYFCDPRYAQHEDCGNTQTQKTAEKVCDLITTFRNGGIANYIVYYGKKHQTPKTAMGGLFKLRTRQEDQLVRKSADSAFEGSNLEARLRRARIQNIIISGVNLNACVHLTAVDGVFAGFNVFVMTDCVANDNRNDPGFRSLIFEDLQENGVHLVESKTVLDALVSEI